MWRFVARAVGDPVGRLEGFELGYPEGFELLMLIHLSGCSPLKCPKSYAQREAMTGLVGVKDER
jgi:hypothetical protein